MDNTEARKRWAMLALLFATRVGLGFQFQTMGSVADPVAARLGLSGAETGTLIGLFLIPGLVLAIPAGLPAAGPRTACWWRSVSPSLALGGAFAAMADGFAVLAAAACSAAQASCCARSISPRWWWTGSPAASWRQRWRSW